MTVDEARDQVWSCIGDSLDRSDDSYGDAALDALIVAVKASMPCYSIAEYRTECPPNDLCHSCEARASQAVPV